MVKLHSVNLGEEYGDIGRLAQNGAKRGGDVGGIERGGGDLVEKRLEEMVVAPVEEGDADRPARQGSRGVESAEAAADDHDVRQGSGLDHKRIFAAGAARVNSRRRAGNRRATMEEGVNRARSYRARDSGRVAGYSCSVVSVGGVSCPGHRVRNNVRPQ